MSISSIHLVEKNRCTLFENLKWHTQEFLTDGHFNLEAGGTQDLKFDMSVQYGHACNKKNWDRKTIATDT